MRPAPVTVVLLTDAPEWCRSLHDALASVDGIRPTVVDARTLRWTPSQPFPSEWDVVVNRLSARPARADEHSLDTQAGVTLYRDIVAALELQSRLTGRPALVINGASCHHVGVSKCLQASLFASLGLPTPLTRMRTSAAPVDENDSAAPTSWLIKPNVGGKGSGIVSVTVGDDTKMGESATYEADGVAVLQEAIGSATGGVGEESGRLHALSPGCVHRIEVLGGRVLYVAHVPTAGTTGTGPQFNNCLGDVCQRRPAPAASFNNCLGDVCQRKPAAAASQQPATASPISVTPPADILPALAAAALRIAAAVGMDMGSVEYVVGDATASNLAPEESSPLHRVWFIDVNPVSTLLQSDAALEVLGGVTGSEHQARYIASRATEVQQRAAEAR
eukprot:CAMPEP_0174853354 /NCGR_PEP_ID=MMETSP1114-20130205/28074_1 /TAXON_ID=312471 /ORGANISM="Neobodo designis, Strain CCAP 1951/1" /LENGTH=389 /DNA_ID=CAMNT_0016087991 /DNA_START=58 /DNA_END=1227 /DNA_ORIENTATION=+